MARRLDQPGPVAEAFTRTIERDESARNKPFSELERFSGQRLGRALAGLIRSSHAREEASVRVWPARALGRFHCGKPDRL